MKFKIIDRTPNRVERSIAPPMREAITLSVKVDGDTSLEALDRGLVIYVAVGAFSANPADRETLQQLTRQLIDAFNKDA